MWVLGSGSGQVAVWWAGSYMWRRVLLQSSKQVTARPFPGSCTAPSECAGAGRGMVWPHGIMAGRSMASWEMWALAVPLRASPKAHKIYLAYLALVLAR